jgi:hypothetical protein
MALPSVAFGAWVGGAGFSLLDNGVAKGLCNSIFASAGSMVGAVVGQESGKKIYLNGTTAPDYEQSIIPGAFIGSVAQRFQQLVLLLGTVLVY